MEELTNVLSQEINIFMYSRTILKWELIPSYTLVVFQIVHSYKRGKRRVPDQKRKKIFQSPISESLVFRFPDKSLFMDWGGSGFQTFYTPTHPMKAKLRQVGVSGSHTSCKFMKLRQQTRDLLQRWDLVPGLLWRVWHSCSIFVYLRYSIVYLTEMSCLRAKLYGSSFGLKSVLVPVQP